MPYYAHSLPECASTEWHPLTKHLYAVADKAAAFARPFGAQDWAYIAGLWHDVGKYGLDFQKFINEETDQQFINESTGSHIDHSVVGAKYAVERYSLLGFLLAYAIAAHHGGLANGISSRKSLQKRLQKTIENCEHAFDEIPQPSQPDPPDFLKQALGNRDPFTLSFFTRMLLSALTDADFLDTERFMQPERASLRSQWGDNVLYRIEKSLDVRAASLSNAEGRVNEERQKVRESCLQASERPPGLFSLTVPTGGGKTLSSLAFALKHARLHRLRRIIYVIPFTTIVEQTADVIRDVINDVDPELAATAVIEHHSNFPPERETQYSRLATENWEAPVIITTSVQFYESLFSNRPGQCRKLHNISESVVILDEAQTLPVHFLEPCLKSLRELTANYNCSAVLCTATQPAVEKREDFSIGLENIEEIVPERYNLYNNLKRVAVNHEGKMTDAEIAERIAGEKQVLCIVNTRSHASQLYALLNDTESVFHLSALMCPAHRQQVLAKIYERLQNGETCRVVSTQLIEAGVDIDFPLVYRSMAGVDAIAQAAGRCNRHGGNAHLGETVVFDPEHQSAERFFAETTNCGRQILELYGDPLNLDAVEHYFRLYYWDNSERWDANAILDKFQLDKRNPEFPFLFDFNDAADKFRLIDDRQKSVIVPWGDEGWDLCEKLRYIYPPERDLLRQLQRYTVQIPTRVWDKHIGRNLELIHEQFAILISPEMHYSEQTGIVLESEESGFFGV